MLACHAHTHVHARAHTRMHTRTHARTLVDFNRRILRYWFDRNGWYQCQRCDCLIEELFPAVTLSEDDTFRWAGKTAGAVGPLAPGQKGRYSWDKIKANIKTVMCNNGFCRRSIPVPDQTAKYSHHLTTEVMTGCADKACAAWERANPPGSVPTLEWLRTVLPIGIFSDKAAQDMGPGADSAEVQDSAKAIKAAARRGIEQGWPSLPASLVDEFVKEFIVAQDLWHFIMRMRRPLKKHKDGNSADVAYTKLIMSVKSSKGRPALKTEAEVQSQMDALNDGLIQWDRQFEVPSLMAQMASRDALTSAHAMQVLCVRQFAQRPDQRPLSWNEAELRGALQEAVPKDAATLQSQLLAEQSIIPDLGETAESDDDTEPSVDTATATAPPEKAFLEMAVEIATRRSPRLMAQQEAQPEQASSAGQAALPQGSAQGSAVAGSEEIGQTHLPMIAAKGGAPQLPDVQAQLKQAKRRANLRAWGPCVQKAPHCQHQYVKRRRIQDRQTSQRKTKTPTVGVLGAF